MGANNYGQLGIGTKSSSNVPEQLTTLDKVIIKDIECRQYSAGISEDGELYLWGLANCKEFLLPQKITSITQTIKHVSLGDCFGVAIDICGQVWSWGKNNDGELGLGDLESRMQPSQIYDIENIEICTCGSNFSIALIQSNSEVIQRKDVNENNKIECQEQYDDMDLNIEDSQIVQEFINNNEDIFYSDNSKLAKMKDENERITKENEELHNQLKIYKEKMEKYSSELESSRKDFESFKKTSCEDLENCVEQINAFKEINKTVF